MYTNTELKSQPFDMVMQDGRIIHYKIIQGTYFHKDTPDRVVYLIEKARQEGIRLCLEYGDVKTGRAWGDSKTGYIGRSTGPVKVPLSVYNKRSMGGEALLDDCIIKIEYANKKVGGVLYQHPAYYKEVTA